MTPSYKYIICVLRSTQDKTQLRTLLIQITGIQQATEVRPFFGATSRDGEWICDKMELTNRREDLSEDWKLEQFVSFMNA